MNMNLNYFSAWLLYFISKLQTWTSLRLSFDYQRDFSTRTFFAHTFADLSNVMKEKLLV